MNYKARSARAVIAVALLGMAGILSADAIANARAGAEYNYSLFATVVLALIVISAALFAWNVAQYAIKNKR